MSAVQLTQSESTAVALTDVRFCAVLPNYNHPARIEGIVEQLMDYGLDCIIVNDGSNTQTREVLEALAQSAESIHLFHHTHNRGKGGAVKTGLHKALKLGYTHALQIDADGQHDIQAVPSFLKAASMHPDSVIVGRPMFDASIPKGRLYPRYITHFWVWFETLSFEIRDSMCGFRIYPLSSTVALLEQSKLGERMDFDIEILVRLFWKNIPFYPIDTHVHYPADGTSHFQLWKDNVLISWMHTKLCVGMLLRSPYLLFRKRRRPSDAVQHWSSMRERGSIWGIRLMLFAYKVMGRTLASLLLYPIIGYFTLTAQKARQTSLQYLRKVYAFKGGHPLFPNEPTARHSFRHFMSFGRAALDKLAAWMGDIKRTDITWPNRELLLKHLREKQGAVLLGAHFGNIEVLRAIAEDNPELKMNVLVFTQHAQHFNNVLRALHPNNQVELIPVEQINVSTGVLLKERVERGEMVVILADRISEGTQHRSQRVSFLGESAAFPEGPFILASLLNCPVYLLFCLHTQKRHYSIHLEAFSERIRLPRKTRKEALHEVIQLYASRLEKLCLQAPYQWFNFYDFWQEQSSDEIEQNSETKS